MIQNQPQNFQNIVRWAPHPAFFPAKPPSTPLPSIFQFKNKPHSLSSPPKQKTNMSSSAAAGDTAKPDETDENFLTKVKGFIANVGEKLEEAVPFGKPSAEVSAINLATMDLSHADIVVDILVSNPNPVPIPLVDITYLIDSNDRRFLSGSIPDARTLDAHGSETVQVPLTLIYTDINSAYNEIGPGTHIPYRVYVELIVDIPVIGRVTVPVERTGDIPVPYKPQVYLKKIKLDKFSFEETCAILHLKIDNQNDFEMRLNSMEYEVWLGEMSIGGAQLAKSATIAKKEGGVVEIPISFRPKDFGTALWDIVQGKGTGYSMKGCINVDTPFGPMNFPFHREGGSTEIKQVEDEDK